MRRFLFYAHDGPRLGPARRAVTVAGALTALDGKASVLLVTGADEVGGLGLPEHVGTLKFPGPDAGAADDAAPVPFAGLRVLREKLLATATETFRPDVMLVDLDPFGEDGELGPALEIVRAAGGRTVLALPDVLDERTAVLEWRNRGFFERIPDYYDLVLVYGQPDLLDPVLGSGFPDDVARITTFCGYVVSSARAQAPAGRSASSRARAPRVLATAGDGADGYPLLEAFIAAAGEARWQATVVAGARCPRAELESIRAQAAEAGVTFRHFVPGLLSEFSSLDALVCMGGYNTLTQAVASRVPTVCVPRLDPGGNQLIRARAFAGRGLVRTVETDPLEPDVLREEIEAALGARRVTRPTLDVGGDRRAAHYLLELATRRAQRYPRERELVA